MKKATVLVLDDSLFAREVLQRGLEQDPNIQVVAKTSNVYEARDKIIQYKPDILVVDVNLPEMSGVDFVKQLLPQYYLPVILISSDGSVKRNAEQSGAVAFLQKPTNDLYDQKDSFIKKLIIMIKSIVNGEDIFSGRFEDILSKIIAIGASTGGAEAIETIVKKLPSAFPPIVISQHMPAKFTYTFANRLDNISRLSVKEARDGDVLLPGIVYISPGGYNSVIKKKNKEHIVNCIENTTGVSTCPCIDMLFGSIAGLKDGTDSIGVLLTGMGKDGAEGLKAMKEAGSKTIIQDEETSVVYGMPRAAYEMGAFDVQLPLNAISGGIVNIVQGS